jgi:hypothetical protein
MNINDWPERFPGGRLIRQGITDLLAGRCTIPSCLVATSHTRLTRAGLLPVSLPHGRLTEPESRLYRLLLGEGGDAYSRYNALRRELVSFEQTLDRAQSDLAASESRGSKKVAG